MEIEATYVCAFCLQVNEIVVDASTGMHQELIEDCQVCCRPNRLMITIDEKMLEASIEAEQS
jgi:Cysteine-rich CPXCG